MRDRRSSTTLEYNLLLTAVFCLLAFGAVMVYSASSTKSVLQSGGEGTEFLVKYLAYGGIGIVAMLFCARHGVKTFQRLAPPLLVLSIILLFAVRIPGIGVQAGGAHRWLAIGPLQFQPVEITKFALVLYAATFFSSRPKQLQTLKGIVSPYLLIVGAVAAIVAGIQHDLGSALVVLFTAFAMLLVSGAAVRHLLTLLASGGFFVTLFALVEPYRRARLTAFLDPWNHIQDIGFQAVQGQIALGSGGFFGRGIGQSVQKAFYLPEAHTDFILAIVGEELGAIGIVGLLVLYGMVAYAGLLAARAATETFEKLLAAGIVSMILCQATLNVFVVLGLAPLTGVPLPFVSFGSTNLCVLLTAVGVLLNIASRRSQPVRAIRPEVQDERDHRYRRDSRSRRTSSGGRRRVAGAWN